jgi:glycosyltransferase involved in cell wall biosynthesis
MKVIQNPVDTKLIREQCYVDSSAVGVPNRRSTKPLFLLAVGRLVPIKDLDTFLAVARELMNRGHLVQPMIVGDGPERDRLFQLAVELELPHPELIFTGETLNPWEFMRRADVLVMTSRSEGYPMVLLEAMACGTQIVSTNCGGTSELLANGRYGQLAEVGNVSSIADAVERALTKPIAKSVLIEGTSRFEPIKLAEKLVALTARNV